MAMSLRLWLLLLRSRLRRVDPAQEIAAKESARRAADLAEQIMARESAALYEDGLGGLLDDRLMLSIEMQFLWGVFHELVQEYPHLPTNGFVRIKLHLIRYLMDARGYSFEHARDEANVIDGLYNEANEYFDTISSYGKDAFHNPAPGHLSAIVLSVCALDEQQQSEA